MKTSLLRSMISKRHLQFLNNFKKKKRHEGPISLPKDVITPLIKAFVRENRPLLANMNIKYNKGGRTVFCPLTAI